MFCTNWAVNDLSEILKTEVLWASTKKDNNFDAREMITIFIYTQTLYSEGGCLFLFPCSYYSLNVPLFVPNMRYLMTTIKQSALLSACACDDGVAPHRGPFIWGCILFHNFYVNNPNTHNREAVLQRWLPTRALQIKQRALTLTKGRAFQK